MKLLTYSVAGKTSWGAVKDGGVVDLAGRSGYPTLRAAIAADALAKLAPLVAANKADHALATIEYLPVIPDPDKILCVGVNYHDHRKEVQREETPYPTMFSRYPNSQVGHGQPILRPRESTHLDFEGEIALIIGRRGRRISEANAWEYLAGYAPYCDGTIRDWQRHTHQWGPGKTFPGTGGFGPWMVTRDEVPDGADMSLVTRLNGQEVQRSSAASMIFSIPRILAYCSVYTELVPGDVIISGTPGGIGAKRNPPLWMKPGDRLEVEVGLVGTLSCPIADEPA